MKKFDIKKIKLRQVSVDQIDDKLLLINLYLTQLLTLIIGIVWLLFQHRNPIRLLHIPEQSNFWMYGVGLTAVVIAVDVLISKFVPEQANDDGGVNERLFRKRPVWHIVVMSFIVAVCEEMLFRGAMQQTFGPYWVSIIFAAIHVRYLRHWIPTGLVFSISYGLGWIYIQSGTLWAPILTHFLVDTIMGLIIRFRRYDEE
jgi:Predicted metal-dependent membrane protease